MSEKPLIFSSEMVRAILESRKTQTRRVIKPQPSLEQKQRVILTDDEGWVIMRAEPSTHRIMKVGCPYGQAGDRLWVRETWAISSFSANFAKQRQLQVAYRAGVSGLSHPKGMTHDLEWRTVDWDTWQKYGTQQYYSWQSPRFIPRWASRITLEITEVRVERLQEIENHPEDFKKEGYSPLYLTNQNGEQFEASIDFAWFENLWDSLNAKRGYPFSSNPWVWCISYSKKESRK